MKFDYRIATIESKREKKNRLHAEMCGRNCNVVHLGCGETAVLSVEDLYGDGIPEKVYTTPVLDIRKNIGVLVIETMNTVYVLERSLCDDNPTEH